MDTLQVTKQSAQAEYKNADFAGKALIVRLFGRQHFFFTIEEWENYIIDRVKTFEDGCRETGEDPSDPKFSSGTPDEIADKKIKVLVMALNMPGWKADYSNPNQRKWRPWFEYSGTGFRFIVSDYDYVNTYASGGSRFSLCSEKISTYLGKQFIDLFNQQLN